MIILSQHLQETNAIQNKKQKLTFRNWCCDYFFIIIIILDQSKDTIRHYKKVSSKLTSGKHKLETVYAKYTVDL